MTTQAAPAGTLLVLDTNTVFDWLVFADPPACAVGAAVRNGQAVWLCSESLWGELTYTLSRPMAQRWEMARKFALTNMDAARTWAAFRAQPGVAPLRCRDGDDQKFLDLALAHPGCTLLSRDKALLRLARRASALGVCIATPTHWVASHAVGRALRESPH